MTRVQALQMQQMQRKLSTWHSFHFLMKPSTALLHHRARIRELTASFRAANPRVFGSVLHGMDVEGSDIDILVDPLPGTTLFDLGGLQVELEDLLGVPVDLLTPANLPLRFRAEVLAQAQPI